MAQLIRDNPYNKDYDDPSNNLNDISRQQYEQYRENWNKINRVGSLHHNRTAVLQATTHHQQNKGKPPVSHEIKPYHLTGREILQTEMDQSRYHQKALVEKQIKKQKQMKSERNKEKFKQGYERASKKMKHVSQSFSDHYDTHQEKYERARNTLVPFIIGGSFIVMILELFYNYIMFYKTLIAVEPGLSKFYYIWALFTYILYFTGAILFFTERRFFFYHPYFFWFIAFASLVLMITSFVLEGVAVAEIKEEPKRKAAQIPVVVDMVFGILLCIFSFYFSYSLYDCHERHTEPFCFKV